MTLEYESVGPFCDTVGARGYRGFNMHTYNGKKVFPLDLREEDVDIGVIAHALSLQNRYLGHTMFPYSVAQHSEYMSYMVAPEFALEALLHDAAEAYCGDMIRPIKHSGMMGDFIAIENACDHVIRKKFGLPETPSKEIKIADQRMAWTERRDVLKPSQSDWGEKVEPFMLTIGERHWESVKQTFLLRFYELTAR